MSTRKRSGSVSIAATSAIRWMRRSALARNWDSLGFIAQEMGREINTLGSKSNHAGMQKCVVRMKDELEKIKEQVLNVL